MKISLFDQFLMCFKIKSIKIKDNLKAFNTFNFISFIKIIIKYLINSFELIFIIENKNNVKF